MKTFLRPHNLSVSPYLNTFLMDEKTIVNSYSEIVNRSFIDTAVRLWNSLPSFIRTTAHTFNRDLLADLRREGGGEWVFLFTFVILFLFVVLLPFAYNIFLIFQFCFLLFFEWFTHLGLNCKNSCNFIQVFYCSYCHRASIHFKLNYY